MIVVYGLEAWGWRLTLGAYAGKVGFLHLFAIRMAGETVNVTTPAAYIGGEPLKAYWLKRYGVPMVEGISHYGQDHDDARAGAIYFMGLLNNTVPC